MRMGLGVFAIPVGVACMVLAAAVFALRTQPRETQRKFGLQQWCRHVSSAPILLITGALCLWVGFWHLNN